MSANLAPAVQALLILFGLALAGAVAGIWLFAFARLRTLTRGRP